MTKGKKDTKFNWTIALAAQTACILEVDAPKVGNINRYHDFEDASLEDFHLSALAIGRPFGYLAGQGVGKTVLEAVKATRDVVSTNTNLGIILLLAPLGMAWCRLVQRIEPHREETRSLAGLWREEIKEVLENLTHEDTAYVYQAIRLASPTGMGQVKEYDVYEEKVPYINLLDAMKQAADHDLVARQYLEGFESILGIGSDVLKNSLQNALSLPQAIAHTHLFLLTQFPDTLIARKLGEQWSKEVQIKASVVWEKGGWLNTCGRQSVCEFDHWLRQNGHKLNPGSTADLIAAILFIFLLEKNGNKIHPNHRRVLNYT